MSYTCPSCDRLCDGYCETCYSRYGSIGAVHPFGYPALTKRSNSCTFKQTGPVHHVQHWYKCWECFPDKTYGVCFSCAKTCKDNGHFIQLHYDPFYCDKGKTRKDVNPSKKCIIL